MSMHEIESLVESSVKTVATASPAPSLARSICFSLYQLQNQFDCGYTVLRVREELEHLGYLFLLPPEQLPEPERSAALNLSDQENFFAGEAYSGHKTYFDRHTGRCCITAGSELWQKLLDLGLLPKSAKADLHELYPLELAELIVPMASETLAGDDKTGADTLGLWYALFPMLCIAAGYDEENTPEPERIRDLLKRLAIPEAFEAAESYCREMDFDDFDEDEMPFLSEWGDPYKKWKKKEESLLPEFCQRMVNEHLSKNNFTEADRFASYIKDEQGVGKLYNRCIVSVACHQWLKLQTQETMPPESILSLAEAKAGFEHLSGLSIPPKLKMLCRFNLAEVQLLLEEFAASAETLKEIYTEGLAELSRKPDGNLKQMQQASLSISFYQLLDNLPDDFPSKKELILQGIPEMMNVPAARKTFTELMPEMPEMTDQLRLNIISCDQLAHYFQE